MPQIQIHMTSWLWNSFQKSELEATLDFHIQHWNYNTYGSGNDPSAQISVTSGLASEDSLTLLTSSFLTFFLVDLPELLLFQDDKEENWLNNEILHQFLKTRTEEMIADFFRNIDHQFPTTNIIQIIIDLIQGQSVPAFGSDQIFLHDLFVSSYSESKNCAFIFSVIFSKKVVGF